MTDLTAFLRARLNEDEATARGAWPDQWRQQPPWDGRPTADTTRPSRPAHLHR